MGLLGTILQDFAGANTNTAQPQGGFTGMGGGISSALVPVLLSVLTSQAGNQTNGNSSPLSGLLSRFEQAGLGSVAQSWVGTGQNQPITPQQVHSVLGEDQVQAMAGQTGMASNDLLSEVARVLPALIDRLTPNGRLPSGPDMSMPVPDLAHV